MDSCPICYEKLEKAAERVTELPDGNLYPAWRYCCYKHGTFFISDDLIAGVKESRELRHVADMYLYPLDGQQRLLRLYEPSPGIRSVSCDIISN